MPRDIPKTTASARLMLLDNFLQATGWTPEEDGWRPPAHLADGHYDRANALRLQIQADVAAVAEIEEERKRQRLHSK